MHYVTRTIHVFNISLDKYGYHIANIIHTSITLNRHIDPTFLYTYPKNTSNFEVYFTCYFQICAHQIRHTFQKIVYIFICTTYEVTTSNHVTMCTVHIFYISLNNCGCHIANTCHMANMLNGIHPTVLHRYANIQITVTNTSHLMDNIYQKFNGLI